MKSKILSPILTSFFVLFFTISVFAVPPSEEVIQRLKDEGRFDEFVQSMAGARAKGINSGVSYDGKGIARQALSPGATFRVLVILIDFSNRPFSAGHVSGSQSDFDDLLFSEGVNPTGSMKEFYIENSYGNFIMEGDVVGWYRATEDFEYYSGNCDGSHGMGSYPTNAARLVEEAVDLADADVDFSLYDNDGNGYVDGIFVVHSGTGYEESGSDCEIHSHQWSISPTFKDGVFVSTYSIEPEESAGNQSLSPIGVFCHEYGHVLGIPDLYDTDYSSRGAGRWALMASGSYNGQSARPSQFTIWCKMRLGWVSPSNITSNQIGVELPAIEWNPVGYRLWKNGQGGNQYFLIENRQRIGFDDNIPGSGILVWHIDDNVGGNSNDWHPRVFLEQADGKFDLQNNYNSGDGGDAYPNPGSNLHFHDKTTPGSKDYNDNSTQVAVWNISPSDSIMTADFDVFWSRPYLHVSAFNFSDLNGGDNDGVLEAGETIELTVTIANDWKTATAADLNMTVDDGTLSIINGSLSLGTISGGGSVNNNGNPLTFEIPLEYTPRIDSFFLEITSDGGSFATVLAIEQNVGRPALLLVDDDNNDNIQTYYSSPLYGRRVPYDLWIKHNSGTPDTSDLNRYDAVIWCTGDLRPAPLTGSDVLVMEYYLDSGGNLFLSGQGIAAQLSTFDSTFMADYLKADYLSTSLIPIITPDSNSPVFGDLKDVVINGGAGNQTDPDQILAAPGGMAEMYYLGTNDLAAVSYSGSYKSMFFSYGLEGIKSTDDRFVNRDTVFNRVLDFLGVDAAAGYPQIATLEIGPGEPMNLVDHAPEISWPYYDAGGAPQQEYDVQVGTDDDWSFVEMWDNGPYAGSDTSVIYSGASLTDGQTYYVRARVSNGTQWSSWRIGQFRMNSLPEAPAALSPDNLDGVISSTPDLEHQNASDGESDVQTYDYELYEDSLLTIIVTQASDQPEGSGSSSWTVDVSLIDDKEYYWRVRAFDSYEYGEWSQSASFWVNSVNVAPAAFSLLLPADTEVLSEMMPTFHWSNSSESDPYDSFQYVFIIDTDSGFTGADTISGLTDSVYTVAESLSYGMEYYWKVLAVDNFGGITESDQVFMFSTLMPGDVNDDGLVNVGDVVTLINYIFREGPAPDPLSIGDVNNDCLCNVGDAVYLINFIFREGSPPIFGCA
jgi:immune inhibitor A